jgi:methoxymalonate biosynthesis protein
VSQQPEAHRLMILGAGVMGCGIAALALGHGVPVALIDDDQRALDQSRRTIAEHLHQGRALGTLPADKPVARLTTGQSPALGADATAVVEAVTEQAVFKTKALVAACKVVDLQTPLMTCTASIPVDELADWAGRPEDVVGTHFMNPPHAIPTVEVVRGRRTAGYVMDAVTGLFAVLNRQMVLVNDVPGFVTGRILYPMINSAARLVGAETASVEDVDTLLRTSMRQVAGPLRTADLIGLDSLVDSLAAIYERTGDESCQPCDVLLEKVRAGELGRKSGRGFYDYEHGHDIESGLGYPDPERGVDA